MNLCILLAGGIGNRMSTIPPKQFVMVEERPVFTYSLESFDQNPNVDAIIIVGLSTWHSFIYEWISKLKIKKVFAVVNQGRTRQHSIYEGLKAAYSSANVSKVIIHDTARPIVFNRVINEVISACPQKGAAIATLPIYDAVYIGKNPDTINQILTDSYAYHGQTPVCIDFQTYYSINHQTSDEEMAAAKGTCTLLFKHNIKVRTVVGDERSFKITTDKDLMKLQNFLAK